MVSVLVPVHNEERHIVRCLESLLAQDYPQERFEIIVLDGVSTDGTERLVRRFEAGTGRVRYVKNPRVLAAAAMNVGTEEAIGDILVRMDAHGRAPARYLSSVVRHLLEGGADHVGVRQHAVGEGFWGESIARGVSSSFGVGGARHRCGRTDGWDEPGWLGGFWATTVRALGGFDESVGPNEDDEFFSRLRKMGGTTYRTADIQIDYYCRTTLARLWVQFYRYGLYKPVVIWRHRRAKLRHFVPPLFVLTLIACGLAAFLSHAAVHWMVAIGASYGLTALLWSGWEGRSGRPRVAMSTPVVFAVLHLSYGTGFLVGIVRCWTHGILKRLGAGSQEAPVGRNGLVE